MSAPRPGDPETFPAPPSFAARTSEPSPVAALAGSAAGFVAALLFGGMLADSIPASPAPPGYAALHGLDARRETARLLLFIVLPIAGGFLGAALGRGRAPAEVPPSTPTPTPLNASGPARFGGLTAAAILAHALSAWIFAIAAFADVALSSPTVLLALLAACSTSLALLLGRGRIGDGAAFLGAAAPVLLLAFSGRRPIPFAAAALAGVFALPAVACALGARSPGLMRALRFATAAVLVPVSVGAVAAAAVLGPPPVADLFENGHELLPASEYLRGERPYRDVVPGHGLLSDGGLDAAALRIFGDDYRGYSRGRKLVGAAFWPAVYAVGLGATGSPLVGLGVALLSLAAFCQYSFLRVIPSLAALALALAASRTGRREWWFGTGAALAVAFLVSVDFALYACAAAAAALWVAREDRSAAFAWLVCGALVPACAGLAALLALGGLPEFASMTFRFLPSLLPVYAQGIPPVLPLDSSTSMTATLYAAAAAGVVLLGAFLPRGKSLPDAARSLVPVSAWIATAMLAVLERQHVNYPYFAVPAFVVLCGLWIRSEARDGLVGTLAAASVVAAFALLHGAPAAPRVIGGAIRPRPSEPGTEPIAVPRRAAGAVFHRPDRVLVARTADLLRRAGFGPRDTWLDFANAPALYFLFERPCPIRYYEVPFYESDAAQREVISAVEANPSVRAVLMTGTYPPIDGVPNAERAPLVARFIRERFRPYLSEDGIEFWIRNDDRAAGMRPRLPGP